MSEEAPQKPDSDVALLYARTDDGDGYRMLRAREGKIESGEVRPVKEGQPIHGGELVKLKPREEAPWLCDVEVACELPTRKGTGPARVTSDAYRQNWGRIFSSSEGGDKKLN